MSFLRTQRLVLARPLKPCILSCRGYGQLNKNGKHVLETSYENYNNVSKNYDKYRRVVGCHIVTNALSRTRVDKKDLQKYDRTDPNNVMRSEISENYFSALSVLDAGCGTGNYLSSLRNLGLGNLHGIELNNGMYSAAVGKLANGAQSRSESETNVSIKQGSIVELSKHFEHDSMDGIIINQVIHHLDTDESRAHNFGRARKAIKECFKVLKPGGTLCINHCTPVQIGYGYWYLQFMPHARHKVMSRYPKDRWMRTELKAAGFKGTSASERCNQNVKAEDTIERPLFIYDTFFTPETHYNFEGVFEENWRSACSIWSLASDDEIELCQKSIADKQLISDTERRSEFIQSDQMLLSYIGCSTTYVAFKP